MRKEGHNMIDPEKQSTRWLSYIDLLGFTEIIRNNHWVNVYTDYITAIRKFTDGDRIEPGIEKVWFSDTFLIYTLNDTVEAFLSIEQTTQLFMYRLILAGIPFRGAMSCETFYADKGNNLFFGKALIEAYQYGENQNWIGFILAPSARKQLERVELPKESFGYVYWDIPTKLDNETRSHPAHIMGWSGEVNGRNIWLDKLVEMQSRPENINYSVKYENAINFIRGNWKQISKR